MPSRRSRKLRAELAAVQARARRLIYFHDSEIIGRAAPVLDLPVSQISGPPPMPRPLADAAPPSRAAIRTIDQLGDRIRATRVAEGMPIDQAARHCGVSVGMLSKLENGKGVNLEHALRALEGLGLTMLVVPKAHAPLLEQAATHAAKASQLAMRADGTHMEEGEAQYF